MQTAPVLEAWGGRKQWDLQEVEPSGWFLGVCLQREMWDPSHPILEMRPLLPLCVLAIWGIFSEHLLWLPADLSRHQAKDASLLQSCSMLIKLLVSNTVTRFGTDLTYTRYLFRLSSRRAPTATVTPGQGHHLSKTLGDHTSLVSTSRVLHQQFSRSLFSGLCILLKK